MLIFARIMAVLPSPYRVPVKLLDSSKAISLPGGSKTSGSVNVIVGDGVEGAVGVRVCAGNCVDVGTIVAVGIATAVVQPVIVKVKRRVIIRCFIGEREGYYRSFLLCLIASTRSCG
jgi:hypothetical protein